MTLVESSQPVKKVTWVESSQHRFLHDSNQLTKNRDSSRVIDSSHSIAVFLLNEYQADICILSHFVWPSGVNVWHIYG